MGLDRTRHEVERDTRELVDAISGRYERIVEARRDPIEPPAPFTATAGGRDGSWAEMRPLEIAHPKNLGSYVQSLRTDTHKTGYLQRLIEEQERAIRVQKQLSNNQPPHRLQWNHKPYEVRRETLTEPRNSSTYTLSWNESYLVEYPSYYNRSTPSPEPSLSLPSSKASSVGTMEAFERLREDRTLGRDHGEQWRIATESDPSKMELPKSGLRSVANVTNKLQQSGVGNMTISRDDTVSDETKAAWRIKCALQTDLASALPPSNVKKPRDQDTILNPMQSNRRDSYGVNIPYPPPPRRTQPLRGLEPRRDGANRYSSLDGTSPAPRHDSSQEPTSRFKVSQYLNPFVAPGQPKEITSYDEANSVRLPQGEIIYSNGPGLDGRPPGMDPFLAPIPTMRPRQEVAASAHQDPILDSYADILSQDSQAALYNEQLSQTRRHRMRYLDDYWRRPHEQPAALVKNKGNMEGWEDDVLLPPFSPENSDLADPMRIQQRQVNPGTHTSTIEFPPYLQEQHMMRLRQQQEAVTQLIQDRQVQQQMLQNIQQSFRMTTD